MKKATKLLILFLSVVIGGVAMMNIFGRTDIGEELFMSQRDKQIAYLKEHEQEIVDFVKSQNSKIETVQIDWEETQWEQIGNGTPQGGGEIIDLFGEFNYIENSDWNVTVRIKDGMPDLTTIGLSNGLRLGDEYFE